MTIHPNYSHRTDQLEKLVAKVPGKYCWTHMVSLAIYKNDGEEAREIKEDARITEGCIKDSIKDGQCYCGRFEKGRVKAE